MTRDCKCNRPSTSHNAAIAGGDNRPHIQVKIKNKYFSALVDTGALLSYISNKVADYCKDLNMPFQEVETPTTVLANGQPVTVRGGYHLEFLINKTKFSQLIHHLPDLTSDMVIGMDILSRNNFRMDLLSNTIYLNDKKVHRSPPTTPYTPVGELSLHLTEDEETRLQQFLDQELPSFSDIRGATKLIQHQIRLSQAEPIKQRYRPQNPRMQAIINQEVDDMLEQGIIEPSSSPWSSPVV
jgi:Retroviral aspartyl protease.